MELEIEKEDLEELIEEHQEELMSEEIQALLVQQHHKAQREASFDNKKEQSNQSISRRGSGVNQQSLSKLS